MHDSFWRGLKKSFLQINYSPVWCKVLFYASSITILFSQFSILLLFSYFQNLWFGEWNKRNRDLHSSRNIHSVTKLCTTNIFSIRVYHFLQYQFAPWKTTSKRMSPRTRERFLSQRPFSCGTGVVSGKRWIPRSIADLLIAPRFGAFSRFLAFMRTWSEQMLRRDRRGSGRLCRWWLVIRWEKPVDGNRYRLDYVLLYSEREIWINWYK